MGTLYCLHHDEDLLYGADPVPCPFCGFGHEETPGASDGETSFEDAHDALVHAMTMDENKNRRARSPARGLRRYW